MTGYSGQKFQFMKKLFAPLFVGFFLQATPVSAAEQCVTLGDSLTFAYEAEFGFRVSAPFFGSFGDNFGPSVRNWVEILNNTSFRNQRFDIGTRSTYRLLSKTLLFRHEYNWALPGLKIEQLRSFVAGESTFSDLIGADPDLSLLLSLSTLNQATALRLGDLENQFRNSAERLVFFIGGNDLREVYGNIYNGGAPGTFVADFISDAAAILDRMRVLNPNIQIVVVNVPHIGITPDVKSSWPTDPVKTARVTSVLLDLNQQLAGLATARGLGHADIFTPTLSLLGTAPLCIHGMTFFNTGSTTGDLNYVWLNGQYSANFHPNTNAQALMANEIIHAFNARYGTGIAPLSATEILSGLLGKSAAAIDMPFATWMSCFGLTGLPGSNDSDGDGVSASVEFATGLNPRLHDSRLILSSVVPNGGGSALELAYPIRLPVSTRYTLRPASATTPSAPFTPFAVLPTTGTDGRAHALLPVSGQRGFLQLQSTVNP
jgi:hypothetical protein